MRSTIEVRIGIETHLQQRRNPRNFRSKGLPFACSSENGRRQCTQCIARRRVGISRSICFHVTPQSTKSFAPQIFSRKFCPYLEMSKCNFSDTGSTCWLFAEYSYSRAGSPSNPFATFTDKSFWRLLSSVSRVCNSDESGSCDEL